MKFGVFYELQVPRPWERETERSLFVNALDQIELADRVGIDYLWITEHHFLEEYSHSSAPEVFLGAVSQRTAKIRLGHGVNLTSPRYNHPVRIAERLATLDLLSNGRVEWGTGESATVLELDGFGVAQDEKHDQWREGAEQAANMMTMTPYPGYRGKSFSMPCRNIVPKPIQRPHPPMWLACSRRESILRAARNGMGALIFGFVTPETAGKWVREYYDIIRSDQCVPIGHTVNANVAAFCGFSLHEDQQEAISRCAEGLGYLGYALSHIWIFGNHRPGRTNLWKDFSHFKDALPIDPSQGPIGDVATVREHLQRYEQTGIDQVCLIQECGRTLHEYICDSLTLFGEQILPEFKEREEQRGREKAAELEPYIEAALARKTRLPELADDMIPLIPSLGRRMTEDAQLDNFPLDETTGGGVPLIGRDPAQKTE